MDKRKPEGEQPSSKSGFDRGCLAACVLFVCVATLNIVFQFFAPPELVLPLTGSMISSLVLVIAGILVVGLAGIMTVFSPRRKYWFICQVLLSLADTVLIASYFVK